MASSSLCLKDPRWWGQRIRGSSVQGLHTIPERAVPAFSHLSAPRRASQHQPRRQTWQLDNACVLPALHHMELARRCRTTTWTMLRTDTSNRLLETNQLWTSMVHHAYAAFQRHRPPHHHVSTAEQWHSETKRCASSCQHHIWNYALISHYSHTWPLWLMCVRTPDLQRVMFHSYSVHVGAHSALLSSRCLVSSSSMSGFRFATWLMRWHFPARQGVVTTRVMPLTGSLPNQKYAF